MSHHPGFRLDIEGLRALAVLLVVACHAGVPGLQGGFVGVDVFFVISGYLITRLLHAEHEGQGRIDLLDFYARRVRRLLPALALMVIAVLVAIRVLYSPIEQPVMLQSVFAAVLYISNLHFAWGATDYWGADAKGDPLLHTWSLGVEEQFYLVWPLLFLMLLGLRRHARPTVVWGGAALLLLLSLGMAAMWTQTRQPEAFFYPVTRAWEFGAGALLVVLELRLVKAGARPLLSVRAGMLLAIAGLFLIACATVLYDGKTPFPGVTAILPVAGAILVIAATVFSGGKVLPVLTLPVVQWLGRMSYGWYLWHWPFLVVGRMVIREPELWQMLMLVVAALVPAALSYHLVELPIRRGVRFQSRWVALGMAVLLPVLAVLVVMRMDVSARVLSETDTYMRYLTIRESAPAVYSAGCDRWYSDAVVIKCVGGQENATKKVVLLGDSHAGQWFSAFHEIAKEEGWQLIFITKSACPIVNASFFYEKIGRIYRECDQWRASAIAEIQTIRPDLVIVSGSENYPFTRNEWEVGTRAAMAGLAKAAGRVVMLRDTPTPPFDVPACLARAQWQPVILAGRCTFSVEKSLSSAHLDMQRGMVSEFPNVRLIDLTAHICGGPVCEVEIGDVIKFRDGNHLSDKFVRTLTPVVRAQLMESLLL